MREGSDAQNLYIKYITGAQMSNAEAGRLARGFPIPGSGLFDQDDAISFSSKLKDTQRRIRQTMARYMLAERRGLIGGLKDSADLPEDVPRFGIPLDDMDSIVMDFAQSVGRDLKKNNTDMDDKTISALVDPEVVKMFGSHLKDLVKQKKK